MESTAQKVVDNVLKFSLKLPVASIGDCHTLEALANRLVDNLGLDIEQYIREPELGQAYAAHTFDALCTRQHVDFAVLRRTLRGLVPAALVLPHMQKLAVIVYDIEPYAEEPYEATKVELCVFLHSAQRGEEPSVIIQICLSRLLRLLH